MTGIGERPRELKWHHAGLMLFGDWGTSRLYVLGLAFAFTGRASFWFIAAMSILLIAVGWCYTITCRLFPDGGGVYSAAKQRSQLLALAGALLLCADYVVTASISCLDAMHYLYDGFKGIEISGVPIPVDAISAALMILAIGLLNFTGPTKTAALAMWVAIATIALTLVIGIFCLPHLGNMRISAPPTQKILDSWIAFTEIILALSGVEAISNVTGTMVQPVKSTARKSILTVMTEIVLLNLVLAAAMCALPDSQLNDADGKFAHQNDMTKVIAAYYVHPAFATVSAVVFAALLLSAVNTAVGALVSLLFMLSRDKELPSSFSRLNRFGMPVWPLIMAMAVPAVLVIAFPNVESLASMYAVGTVGAITIDLGSVCTNRRLEMKRWERILLACVAFVLLLVEITILICKPEARGFAMIVLVCGLGARLATLVANPAASVPASQRKTLTMFSLVMAIAIFGSVVGLGSVAPTAGVVVSTALVVVIIGVTHKTGFYRDRIMAAAKAAPPPPRRLLFPGHYKPASRIMVATQGNPRILKFAFNEAKKHEAELQLLFVRHLAVTPMGPIPVSKLDEDADALKLLEQTQTQAHEEGIPFRFVYGVARDIPETILDLAVTHGADMLILGATRRGALWKTMKGDVIQAVAEHLPENVGLLIHA